MNLTIQGTQHGREKASRRLAKMLGEKMKTSIVIFSLIMLVSSSALACEGAYKGKRIIKSYPMSGMNLKQLNTFLSVAKEHIKDKFILNISINNGRSAIIKTGAQYNPSYGDCNFFYFGKKNGKWYLDSKS